MDDNKPEEQPQLTPEQEVLMSEGVAQALRELQKREAEKEAEEPTIKPNRAFWRMFGLRGSKNTTKRPGFIGTDGRPRVWISHKKKEDTEVEST